MLQLLMMQAVGDGAQSATVLHTIAPLHGLGAPPVPALLLLLDVVLELLLALVVAWPPAPVVATPPPHPPEKERVTLAARTSAAANARGFSILQPNTAPGLEQGQSESYSGSVTAWNPPAQASA
jgi:hypothetical protein